MKKYLYIDDSPCDRLLAEHALAGEAEVTCADGAVAGLALLAAGNYDLVISDMMMPGPSGLDVARAVAAGPGTPLILTSSCRSLTSFEDYTGLGNYLGFILKPLDAEKVRLLTQAAEA